MTEAKGSAAGAGAAGTAAMDVVDAAMLAANAAARQKRERWVRLSTMKVWEIALILVRAWNNRVVGL